MADHQGAAAAADNEGTRPAGVFASLRGLLDTVLGIAATRFELIGVEVAEERERVVALLITVLALVVAVAFALLMLTLFVIILFWENRLIAAGACVLVYGGLGVWLLSRLRTQLETHPPMFAATVAELQKDREALRESIKRTDAAPPSS